MNFFANPLSSWYHSARNDNRFDIFFVKWDQFVLEILVFDRLICFLLLFSFISYSRNYFSGCLATNSINDIPNLLSRFRLYFPEMATLNNDFIGKILRTLKKSFKIKFLFHIQIKKNPDWLLIETYVPPYIIFSFKWTLQLSSNDSKCQIINVIVFVLHPRVFLFSNNNNNWNNKNE